MRQSCRILIGCVVAVWLLTPLTAPCQPEAKGVIVESVSPGSSAEKLGIKVGDRLLTYDGKPLVSPLTLLALRQNTFDKKEVALRLQRGSETLTLTVPVASLGLEARPELPPAALKLYEEGRSAQRAQKTDEAIAKWTEAAKAAQEVGDKTMAAHLYGLVGSVYTNQRRWKEAVAARTTAWELWKSLAPQPSTMQKEAAVDAAAISRMLWGIGWCCQQISEFAVARQWYEQAWQWDSAAGYEMWAAADLTDLGIIAQARGDLTAAQDYFSRALSIHKRLVPDKLPVAVNLNNLGTVAYQRGDLSEAINFQTRALNICQRLAERSPSVSNSPSYALIWGRVLNSLGVLAGNRGELREAADFFTRSLTAYERWSSDSPEVAHTLTNLGNVAWYRGDWDMAREYFTHALAIRQRLNPDSLDVAQSFTSLGAVAYRSVDFKTARDYYARALSIYQNLAPQSLAVASVLANLGEVAFEEGDLETAQDHFRRALAIQEPRAPHSLDVASSLNDLGEVAFRRHDLSAARDHFTRALRMQERFCSESPLVGRSHYNVGKVAFEERRFNDALTSFQRAVDIIEFQRRQMTSIESRALLLARMDEPYVGLVRAHLALDNPSDAFATIERSHARGLVEMLAERDVDFSTDAPKQLLQKQQQLDAARDVAYRRLSQLSPDQDAERIEQVRAQLQTFAVEQRQLANEIRRASPKYAALQYPQPLDLKGTQRELDEGTLLLTYWVDKKMSVLFCVTKTELQAHRLAVEESDLRDRIGKFRSAIAQRGDFRSLARDLYDLLVRPAQSQIDKAERVLICPDGPLHTLPFAALVEGRGRKGKEGEVEGSKGKGGEERYFIEAKSLHVVASMSVYAELRKTSQDQPRPANPSQHTLLALGDPVYEATTDAAKQAAHDFVTRGGKLTPLPHTRQELQAIQDLYGNQATLRLGKDASETAVKREAAQARIIHFACHGILDDRNPLGSALALSAEGEADGQPSAEDGWLRAYEILEKIRLNADLVVLSACQSGLGAEMKNEGIVGMTRAFQYAGAKNVVVSLWEIMDKSTSQLMTEFYRQLKAGKRKDEALQQAQVKLLKNSPYRHPYYWAPFVLVGDGK